MTEGPHNIELKRAVRYLYGKGLITRDKDIADKTFSKNSVVSIYINGKQKASFKFINRFEVAFKISLMDFLNEDSKVSQVPGIDQEAMILANLKVMLHYLVEIRANNEKRSIESVRKEMSEEIDKNYKEIVKSKK